MVLQYICTEQDLYLVYIPVHCINYMYLRVTVVNTLFSMCHSVCFLLNHVDKKLAHFEMVNTPLLPIVFKSVGLFTKKLTSLKQAG